MKINLRETSEIWLRTAARDLQNKLEALMTKTSATVDELARVLEIPRMEINSILGGNGTDSLETFVKIIMASGETLAVMPQMLDPYGMPLGGQMPPKPSFIPQGKPMGMVDEEYRPRPQAAMHTCHCHNHGQEIDAEREERFARHPHFGANVSPRVNFRTPLQRGSSPFDTMSQSELIGIIRKKLWDTEIDVNEASRDELIDLLKEKDCRFRQFKAEEERQGTMGHEYAPRRTEVPSERNERVGTLEQRIKEMLDINPQLKEVIRRMV